MCLTLPEIGRIVGADAAAAGVCRPGGLSSADFDVAAAVAAVVGAVEKPWPDHWNS